MNPETEAITAQHIEGQYGAAAYVDGYASSHSHSQSPRPQSQTLCSIQHYCINIRKLIENHFKFQERHTSWAREFKAGISTFVTMAYMLCVCI